MSNNGLKRAANWCDRRFPTAERGTSHNMPAGVRRFWRYQVDCGWAWVVCFASFFVQCVIFGTIQSFGTLFISLLNDFKSGESATGKRCVSMHFRVISL